MDLLRKLFRRERPPIEALIPLLLDKSTDLGARDDIAMDLSQSDKPEAEAALLRIVLDHSDEEMVIDSAGHSIWEIWSRPGKRDDQLIQQMHPSARKFFRVGA